MPLPKSLRRHGWSRSRTGLCLAAALGLGAAACSMKMPDLDAVRDSPLFDRRVKETPRQKTVRECNLETERFRVNCKYCHTTEKEADIAAPDKLKLTESGRRAKIMRESPTFGLQQQCSLCHQSKFGLTGYAAKIFGPEGARHRELEQELNAPIRQ